MKKTYIQPSIKLVTTTLNHQILAGSDLNLGYGDQKNDDIYTSSKDDLEDFEDWDFEF